MEYLEQICLLLECADERALRLILQFARAVIVEKE